MDMFKFKDIKFNFRISVLNRVMETRKCLPLMKTRSLNADYLQSSLNDYLYQVRKAVYLFLFALVLIA